MGSILAMGEAGMRTLPIVAGPNGECWVFCPNHDGKRCIRLGYRAPDGDPCPVSATNTESDKKAQDACQK